MVLLQHQVVVVSWFIAPGPTTKFVTMTMMLSCRSVICNWSTCWVLLPDIECQCWFQYLFGVVGGKVVLLSLMVCADFVQKYIFLMVNRILSSHSDVRAPIISGIVEIRALGESFFKQLHNQYASPEIWAKEREIFASCPTQHNLFTAKNHWEGFSGQRQQAKVGSSFFGQLAKIG